MTALLRTAALVAVIVAGAPVATGHHISDDQLTLARSFIAEAGWTAQQDWAAMAHIHRRRARNAGVSLATQVQAYCAIWKRSSERARWVLDLHPSMRQPVGWPSQRVRWSEHARYWHIALARARLFVHTPGRVRDPCKGRAHHFGGAMDDPAPGWRAVDCGRMRQRYWKVR